jgi:hypothetical protein
MVVLAGPLAMSFPASSLAASNTQASPTVICAKTKAQISPHRAHVGDDLVFRVSVTNCGRTIYMHWILRLAAPCPGQSVRVDERGRFLKGLTEELFPGDRVACRGTYRVTAKAFHNGELLDRASQYAHVQP